MIGLLSFVAFILLFLIVFQIAKTSELATIINGDPDDYEDASKINGVILMAFLIFGMIGIVWSGFIFIPKMLPQSASAHGVVTDNLFNVTLIFIGIVFVLTHIVLFWFTFRYREKKGNVAYFYPHNNKLELIWTVIPAIVMTILVVMGMRAWFDIFPDLDELPEDLMVIEVTAKQFIWTPRYAGMDGEFGDRIIDTVHISPTNELGVDWTDPNSHDDIYPREIHLIKDQPTYFKLGALDVLHSFYLPHFRVKMDCVPGTPTSFYVTPIKTTAEMREELSTKPEWQKIDPETGEPKWKNFKYELACAELCGKSHYAMQMDVIVETAEEFKAWAESQKSYYDVVIKPTLGEVEPRIKVEDTKVGSLNKTDDEHSSM